MGKLGLFAWAMLALVGVASAQTPLRSTSEHPLYPAQSLVLVGVKLGMTPPEAAAAVKGAGYTRTEQSLGENWDAQLARLIAMERSVRVPGSGKIVRREEYRKGEEHLQIEYNATPRGPVVATARYELRPEAIDAARFTQAALARYGIPTRPSNEEIMYCSVGEVNCTPLPFGGPTREPHIIVDVPLRAITLNMGDRLRREYNAMERAEMDRRAPKVAHPTF